MYVKSIVTGYDLTEGKIYTVDSEYDSVYELKCDIDIYCRNKDLFAVVTEEEILQGLSEKEMCAYCKYHAQGCGGGGIKNYGSGQIYPPCSDDKLMDLIDIESYIQDMEV